MAQREKMRVRHATIGGIRIKESIEGSEIRVHEERRTRGRVAANIRDSRLRIIEILWFQSNRD